MRISDWSSDVCSSDLLPGWFLPGNRLGAGKTGHALEQRASASSGRPGPLEHIVRPRAGSNRLPAVEKKFVLPARRGGKRRTLGRASWRERVCKNGEISVVAVSLKKKI